MKKKPKKKKKKDKEEEGKKAKKQDKEEDDSDIEENLNTVELDENGYYTFKVPGVINLKLTLKIV